MDIIVLLYILKISILMNQSARRPADMPARPRLVLHRKRPKPYRVFGWELGGLGWI